MRNKCKFKDINDFARFGKVGPLLKMQTPQRNGKESPHHKWATLHGIERGEDTPIYVGVIGKFGKKDNDCGVFVMDKFINPGRPTIEGEQLPDALSQTGVTSVLYQNRYILVFGNTRDVFVIDAFPKEKSLL